MKLHFKKRRDKIFRKFVRFILAVFLFAISRRYKSRDNFAEFITQSWWLFDGTSGDYLMERNFFLLLLVRISCNYSLDVIYVFAAVFRLVRCKTFMPTWTSYTTKWNRKYRAEKNGSNGRNKSEYTVTKVITVTCIFSTVDCRNSGPRRWIRTGIQPLFPRIVTARYYIIQYIHLRVRFISSVFSPINASPLIR